MPRRPRRERAHFPDANLRAERGHRKSIARFGVRVSQPPIITVGAPSTIVPPCAVMSPMRAAGGPPTSTVIEPFTIVSGGPTHTHMLPTLAAGIIAMITVGA